ncbi:MAG: M48 family metallopeptidase [Leptospira sp.]|nr:M48 family metallopeptidase [Leptospira sp.]
MILSKDIIAEQHSVTFEAKKINYSLIRTNRRTLAIFVYPDKTVLVKAPLFVRSTDIQNRIIKKAKWIIKKQEHFGNYRPQVLPKEYLQGETHRFLGEDYLLKIVTAKDTKVELQNEYILVSLSKTENRTLIKKALNHWFMDQAKTVFGERIEHCLELMKSFGLPVARFKIKKMRSRWGSCSINHNISLNLKLIHAPIECIDYLIVHELCHLKEHNHSKNFYKLLSAVFPDLKERQHKLKSGI